jgi:hypothetical protein
MRFTQRHKIRPPTRISGSTAGWLAVPEACALGRWVAGASAQSWVSREFPTPGAPIPFQAVDGAPLGAHVALFHHRSPHHDEQTCKGTGGHCSLAGDGEGMRMANELRIPTPSLAGMQQ